MRTLRTTHKEQSWKIIRLAASLFACVQCCAWAQVKSEDVWLYMPLDGSLEAAVPAKGLKVFRLLSANKNKPEFVEGVRGKALRVTERNQTEFSFRPMMKTFPAKRGSVIIWFYTTLQLDDPKHVDVWLMDSAWAHFDMHLNNGRLMFYAGTKSDKFVIGKLDDFKHRWINHWHCAVGTWDGSKVRLYMDGELIGSRDDVTAGIDPKLIFEIRLGALISHGYSPGSYEGTGMTTPRELSHFLDGDIDEFKILKVPLSKVEVKQMFLHDKK